MRSDGSKRATGKNFACLFFLKRCCGVMATFLQIDESCSACVSSKAQKEGKVFGLPQRSKNCLVIEEWWTAVLGSMHSTHLDPSPSLDCGMLGYKEVSCSHFLAKGEVLKRAGFCWAHKFL